MAARDRSYTLRTLIDLVGAAGVLTGLIFVGLELRNNTLAIRAETFQSLTDISRDDGSRRRWPKEAIPGSPLPVAPARSI